MIYYYMITFLGDNAICRTVKWFSLRPLPAYKRWWRYIYKEIRSCVRMDRVVTALLVHLCLWYLFLKT